MSGYLSMVGATFPTAPPVRSAKSRHFSMDGINILSLLSLLAL